MKRRNLAIIYLLILTIGTIVSLYIPKQETEKVDAATTVIPDEAIRLRILANSDREADQAVKRLIRDEVNRDITEWVAELTSLEEAREVIIAHLDEIQATAEDVIAKEGLTQSVKVDFGQAAFPTKLYGQFLYPAGDYEAVIITLGEGDGANWWCVLFPPLCFLDFSNGTAISQSPFDEEEGSAVTTEQTEVTETAANKTDVVSQPAVEEEEDTTTNQQTAVEVEIEGETDQAEEQVENETKETVSQPESESASKELIEVTDSKENIEAEVEPEAKDNEEKEAEIKQEQTIAASTVQIYDGTEEPQIIKKSLFGEIFTNLFK